MTDLFNTGIRPAIDKWLLDESNKTRSYGEYWSASSAGYCMRKNIFERLGVPPVTRDARKQRVFTSGHIFHEWMQRITREAGLSIAQETELQDEDLMIRGHIDDLVLVPNPVPVAALSNIDGTASNTEHLILYDYKTQNSRAFSYKRESMSHFHRLQLGTYMMMLRKDNGNSILWKLEHSSININIVGELCESRILKISKDDLRMSEEQLLWTPQLEKDVLDYWTTLNKYWNDKKMPPCTCADHEGGFMARDKYNPFYFNDEPCSLDYFKQWKENNNVETN